MRKSQIWIASTALLACTGLIIWAAGLTAPDATLPAASRLLSNKNDTAKTEAELRAERIAFFNTVIEPVIIEADKRNRESAQRCVETLKESFNGYRNGIKPFCIEINTWGTRLGVIRRMPGDWWYEKTDVDDFINQKFARYLFTDEKLTEDIESALTQFRNEVRNNQSEMLAEVRLSISESELTSVPPVEPQDFITDMAKEIQDFGADSARATLVKGITVKVASAAGGAAGEFLLSQLIVELSAMTGTATTAAGGATAGGAVAGGGGGSLGGPVGAAAGIAVGLVIGGVIDWWMSSKFETQMTEKLNQLIDEISDLSINGSSERPGLKPGLEGSCDLMLQSYRDLLTKIIIEGGRS